MARDDRAKKFVGKRTSFQVKGSPGISRNVTWNEEKGCYLSPLRGKIFKAHRYISLHGKKVREEKNFNTIEEARNWQHSADSRVAVEITSDKSPTLGNVILAWKDSWRTLAENTKIQYNKCLPFYESINEMEMEQIQALDIDNLVQIWREKSGGYRDNRFSFRKELETLTYIFSWYHDNFDGSSGKVPFKQRHWDKIIIKKAGKSRRKYMTDLEVAQFFSALKTVSLMFYVFAFTQFKQIMRVSETAAMDRESFNRSSRTYIMSSHVVWPRIGGATPYIEGGTKTLSSDDQHLMHLFEEVAELLDQLPPHPRSNLFFHDNGEILTYRQIQYMYDKAFEIAGLPFRGTHVLRHTGSTQFYNDSGDLLALQQMGAWKNSRMPEHYAKVLSAKAKNAITKLESKSKLKLVK